MPPASRPTEDAPAGFISMAAAEELISAKVNEATQAMLALLSERQGASAPGADFANQLATAIASLNNQGRRNAVSPDEMQRRDKARDDMFLLLNELNDDGEVPEYRLKRKVVLEEQIIDPMWIHPNTKKQMHTTIAWAGVPNGAMEPLNEPASRVFALFSTWIGGVEQRNERLRVTPRGLVIVEGLRANNNQAAPPVAGPRSGGALKITGRGPPGEEIVQTNVLGTIAKPAMQINGRAVA
jgi:hypothetical protein